MASNFNSDNLKILIVVGTVRKERKSRLIADWYIKQAKAIHTDVDFEILDLKDENLPLFSEATSPMFHNYSEIQNKLASKISSADGFVFVTAEYNHSMPGSLKNFLDYLFAEWNYKPATYVGYGAVGGIRAIEHLVQVMTELRVVSIANSADIIMINEVWSALDENGTPKPEFVHGDIEKQLKELTWWASTLKTARK